MLSDFAAELWQELRRFMTPGERSEAADVMVQTLINHDESIEDIAGAFAGDTDVREVMRQYHTEDVDFDEDADDRYEADPDEEW